LKLIVSLIILNLSYPLTLESTLFAENFKKPLFLCPHPSEKNIFFVVEQGGLIWKIKDKVKSNKPFINLKSRVHKPIIPGDERGLLGLALPSNFSETKIVYVNYVNKKDETIISRINTSVFSEEILIQFKQPYFNHNGGMMAFGPDGYLYVGVGDGGSAGDPLGNAQNLTNFFGSILRIDVSTNNGYKIPSSNPFIGQKNTKPEIWAYGLRNPWRFSFDMLTGDLYSGDVGQNKWEEINFQPADSKGGENYGWNRMEGVEAYDKFSAISDATLPIYTYPNDANIFKVLLGWDEDESLGCSVTGGYVYRGKSFPEIYGHYIFGDYCTGRIWSFNFENDKVTDFQDLTDNINFANGDYTPYISSFGQGLNGELYIVDYSGDIYMIGKD